MEEHIFAFYLSDLSSQNSPTSIITITDPVLYHRIVRVLRLMVGDTCILFNNNHHLVASITGLHSKAITVSVIKSAANVVYYPTLVAALPVLKRDDLESAVNGLTQVGASTIQLITTQKSHGWHNTQKELDRLKQISISAAEQSKNFTIPAILPPLSLSELLTDYSQSSMILFHPTGTPINSLCTRVPSTDSFVVMVGPEGDLTSQELEFLRVAHVQFFTLTQTVLRASMAIQLGAGLLRSLLR